MSSLYDPQETPNTMPTDEKKLPYAPTQPAMKSAAAPGPNAKSTVAMPQVPEWAIELTRSVKEGFSHLHEKVDTLSSNVDIVRDDSRDTKLRLVRIEAWRETIEERMTQNSQRAKLPSTHDLETQKALADEIAAREALTKEVALIKAETQAQSVALVGIAADASKAVTGFVHQHPVLFRSLATIATTIATSIAAWLAAKGH